MNATLKRQFLAKIHQLSGLLKYSEPTMGMLVKAIFMACAGWQGGASFAYCEDSTFQRFSWRVKDDLGRAAEESHGHGHPSTGSPSARRKKSSTRKVRG